GALALQAALAPVDHHAADRRVGADGELGLLRPARPQHLEPELLHGTCDLLQARTFERSSGKCRRAEQELEMPVVFHAGVASAQGCSSSRNTCGGFVAPGVTANVSGRSEFGIRPASTTSLAIASGRLPACHKHSSV